MMAIVLTPARYVGAEELEDDNEAFEEKMLHLTKKLEQQFNELEVTEAILNGNQKQAKQGRLEYRYDFQFNRE